MKHKKMMLIIVLSVFVVGMVMGAASASHTFTKGKYSATISDSKYDSLKNKAKKGKAVSYTLKTGKYKTYKAPKYKTKKVTKYKWKYKKVLQTKTVYNQDYSDSTEYEYDVDKYFNNGWRYYGYTTTTEKGGKVHKFYAKFKKKVKVNSYKKVKSGYKNVKKPVYMTIGNMDISGEPMGKEIRVLHVYTDYGIVDT